MYVNSSTTDKTPPEDEYICMPITFPARMFKSSRGLHKSTVFNERDFLFSPSHKVSKSFAKAIAAQKMICEYHLRQSHVLPLTRQCLFFSLISTINLLLESGGTISASIAITMILLYTLPKVVSIQLSSARNY